MSETEEKKYLSLEEIMYSDATNDVYIPALDRYVKVKNASIRDRREAETMAMKHPGWGTMSAQDKENEITKMLALNIIVEPKITYEQYMTAQDNIFQIILNTVATDYYNRLTGLMEEKTGKDLDSFLQELTETMQKDSLPSLEQETSTG